MKSALAVLPRLGIAPLFPAHGALLSSISRTNATANNFKTASNLEIQSQALNPMKTFEISSAAVMEDFGAAIAAAATATEITIFLSGDLAAGKTTLARGYLRRLGHPGPVKSPTFTLVESYALNGRAVHHFDLYRLEDPEELEYIGLDEYFEAGADCLVEWPERGVGALPVPDLNIRLEVRGEARQAHVVAETENGDKLLDEINFNY